MKDGYIPHIEWELLHEKIEIVDFDSKEDLPKGTQSVEIFRDEDYSLKGKIRGELYQGSSYDFPEFPAGTIAQSFSC